jgi:hypothetical protein
MEDREFQRFPKLETVIAKNLFEISIFRGSGILKKRSNKPIEI